MHKSAVVICEFLLIGLSFWKKLVGICTPLLVGSCFSLQRGSVRSEALRNEHTDA